MTITSLVKLLQGARILFRIWHTVVPGRSVTHKRHSLPFVGMGDDAVGLAPLEGQLIEHVEQRGVVVTIDFPNREAECGPLVVQRVEMHGSLGEIALLLTIAIDYYCEIVEPIVRG